MSLDTASFTSLYLTFELNCSPPVVWGRSAAEAQRLSTGQSVCLSCGCSRQQLPGCRASSALGSGGDPSPLHRWRASGRIAMSQNYNNPSLSSSLNNKSLRFELNLTRKEQKAPGGSVVTMSNLNICYWKKSTLMLNLSMHWAKTNRT